jgi:hypothetical protein
VNILSNYGAQGLAARDRYVPKNGTSGKYRPRSLMDWRLRGLPVPAQRFGCQDTSGNLIDDVRGETLVPQGSPLPTYQQSGTDASFATKCVKTLDGTSAQGFIRNAGGLHNCNVQSIVKLIECEVFASGGTRGLYTVSHNIHLLAVLSNGHLEMIVSGGSTTAGTVDYRDGHHHWICIEDIPGAPVTKHVGSGLVRVSTDKEQFTCTWAAVNNDGNKGPGGSQGVAATVGYFDDIEWVGSDAEWISGTLGPKALLQSFGVTVTGY